ANADTGSRGAIQALAEVRQGKDLCRTFTASRERFDGVALDALEVPRADLDAALADTTPEVRAAIMASLDARYPGLPIVPELSSGGTDGMHYRALGMNTVGIGNAAMRSADIFAHGLNERIRVEDFYKGLDHWYLVMKKLAG
ncbi:MAG: M20/M25/M40 family metallo-hydrolase, partial [Blastomonas sp.]|nr:M20/M25/M40 family metallo-hydrolase [Blastomonas sp.]